jgi:hypothetical protein
MLLSNIKSVIADSTNLYLDWELENGNSAGHLTISGYPTAIEENQTYKVEITLTHEKGAIPNFDYLNFTVKWSNNDNLSSLLGYSSIHSALEKNGTTLISHWKSQEIPNNQQEGTLRIVTNNGDTLKTEPEIIKVKFKASNTINLNVQSSLNKGDIMETKGNITIESNSITSEGIIISLSYLNPNGTEILRKVTTNKDGNFIDKFDPNMEGTWWCKASWNGSEKYSKASSEIIPFEVNSQIPFWLYIGTVVLALWAIISLIIYRWPNDWWPSKPEDIYPPPKEK